MADIKLVVRVPSTEEKAYLEEKVDTFNINLTGIPFGGESAVLAYDAEDRLIGGANGYQWGDAFTVSYLWLEPDWRGQDIGTQLMNSIEQDAIERGCKQLYLDTYSFQAIDFYRKLGYDVIGTLENFPTPHTHYFLKKNLLVS